MILMGVYGKITNSPQLNAGAQNNTGGSNLLAHRTKSGPSTPNGRPDAVRLAAWQVLLA